MSYIYYKEALKDITKPCLFLDTHLFKENIQTILNASNGKKIRIASKSIRSLPILKDILNYSTTFQGVMCFTADEAIYLNNNRSEEHTSELQSRDHLVCRLLLEKKNYLPD